MTTLKDDDILSFSVNTKSDTFKETKGHYQFFDADRYTNEGGYSVVDYSSEFNQYLTDSTNTETIDLYLYDERDAQAMVERYNFFHSLSQSVVTVKGKLNLSLFNLNDRVGLDLERLYKRFGASSDSRKVGLVSKITRNGYDTTIGISDLGNLFNRSSVITLDTASDYASADSDEKIKNGYILDNNLDIPNVSNSELWGTGLIS